MRTRTLPTAVLTAALLTACGTGDTSGTASPPAPPASPSTTSSTGSGSGSGSGDDSTTDRTDPSGPYDLVPAHLRVEEQDGGDRVVLTFRGRGTAGWSARYDDQAVLDGSGDVVDLDGDVVLAIAVFGTPTRPADRVRRVPVSVGGDVVDAYVGAAWEGVTQVFLGLDAGRTPYRISTLDSPSRLVVELAG